MTLILLFVGVIISFEYVPNPLLKPSMSVDGAIIDTQNDYLLVFVSIHNPTHARHSLDLDRVDMQMTFSDVAGTTQTLSRVVSYFWGGYEVYGFSVSDIKVTHVDLDPCKGVGEFLLFDIPHLSGVQKGTVNVEAQFALDRQYASISGQVEALVNPINTGTQTTTTNPPPEPSECLLP